MPNIPAGVIFIWTGTNASIPAGWVRETTLDGKFPKAHANGSTEPNQTGGAATHTHTSSAHTHTMGAHTHSVSIGAGSGSSADSDTSVDGCIIAGHTHPSPVTSGAVASVSISSVAATYTAFSNNPPYYDVIFIKPSSGKSGLPQNAVALSEDSGFANNTGSYKGCYICDGNNSTPNLTNKYLRGANASGDAGGTGGSTTNSHTLSHTHSISHAHSAVTVSASSSQRINSTAGGPDSATYTHTHSMSLDALASSSSDTPATTTTETVEPAYKKLIAFQNRNTNSVAPLGMVGLWLGSLSSIPNNYELVSSMYDKHLKIGANAGEIGNTGGSNTHAHAESTHTHAAIAHNHTASGLGHTNATASRNSGAATATASTTHSATVANENITLSTGATTADASSNEPEYRTVAFIKLASKLSNASAVFGLL